MIKNPVRIEFLGLSFLLLASCAPYVMIGGRYTASAENFEADLPSGWRKHERAFDNHPLSRAMLEELAKRRDVNWDTLRITRDGLLLQQIAISRVGIDQELRHTKKKFSKGMLPQEVADLIIDDIRSNPNLTNQQIIENSPAVVGNYPGFKLTYTYETKKGLVMRAAYYGVVRGSWYYYLLYEAPNRYYFAKDSPVFEKVKQTFALLRAEGG